MMYNYLLHHGLIESARKYPNLPAVKSKSGSITYSELDRKSTIFANLLTSRGVAPGHVVGVYLHKSIETLIAFFGVLKAGCCYIPLDSHYSPLPRIKEIIKLSGMSHLVTDSDLWNSLVSENESGEREFISKLKVFFVDTMAGEQESEAADPAKNIRDFNRERHFLYTESGIPEEFTPCEATDSDLAYILYTSGSTGVPKGVTITHLNALTFIKWSLNYFKPLPGEQFSSFAPFHFDLSVFDIFVSIGSGGCLNILPFEMSNNPRMILKWIGTEKISFFYSVPSVWVAILNYARLQEGQLPSLQHILFAGEVFPPKYLKQLMTLLPEAHYYNLYGPTETNVCTYYKVPHKDVIGSSPVPIGRACENTETLVLTDSEKHAQPGEQGELLVKGSIVTGGYYRDEERTNASFREVETGGSLKSYYKTGDIVKVGADGLFEYMGRKDLMVKISGFRVEIQEVEHAFLQLKEVEEACVVVKQREESGAAYLCAAVKVKQGCNPGITGIKEQLADSVPRYFVPEEIVLRDTIPKNANGKMDRQTIKALLEQE